MIAKLANTLGIILAVCTALLIFEEFHVFLILKPTSTSMEVHNMRADLFPETLICQTPAYDIEAIQRNGYTSSFWYTVGKNRTGHLIGWAGIFKNETKSLIDEIVWQKNSSVPPKVKLKLRHKNKYEFQTLKLDFARVFYPLGRCFVATVPKEAWKKTVVGLLLGDILDNASSEPKNYRLFFRAASDNAKLLLPPFQMIGMM